MPTDGMMNKPPGPAETTLRPLLRSDLPSLHRLWLAVDRAESLEWAGSLAELEKDYEDPWSPPATDTRVAATPSGEIAGFARVYKNPILGEEARAHLDLEVHPEFRGLGLEEKLQDWAEQRGRERLLADTAAATRQLRVSCRQTRTARLTFYGDRGFIPDRAYYRMRRDLRDPIPEKPDIAGVALTALDPTLHLSAARAFNDSFQDHWGFERISEEDFLSSFVGHPEFRRDLTLVAVAGGEVVGFSFNYVNDEENERLGFRQAWIGQLGTLREWRNRGVASTLLCRSMSLFRAAGMDYAVLGVDTENLTGALALYERVGFKVVSRVQSLSKPVLP